MMKDVRENPNPAIAIVGAGRLGAALARLLHERGAPLTAIASRSLDHARSAAETLHGVEAVQIDAVPRAASHVLIAVSDEAIAAVADRLHRAGFTDGVALHTSGGRSSDELAVLRGSGAAIGALHPLQTIASSRQGAAALPGSYFASCGDERATAWASRLVDIMGGKMLRVRQDRWALYHSAAVFASNYLITSIDAALEALEASGVPRAEGLAALAPISRAAVNNAFELGPESALTGPISRGDTRTVLHNRDSLRAISRASQEAYQALGLRTLPVAERGGLPASVLAQLRQALSEPLPS